MSVVLARPDAGGLIVYLGIVFIRTLRAEWRRWHALRLGPWRPLTVPNVN